MLENLQQMAASAIEKYTALAKEKLRKPPVFEVTFAQHVVDEHKWLVGCAMQGGDLIYSGIRPSYCMARFFQFIFSYTNTSKAGRCEISKNGYQSLKFGSKPASSRSVKLRQTPGFSVPSFTLTIRVRLNCTTLYPKASAIRRICRFKP